MSIFQSKESSFIEAIKKGDVAFLKKFLEKNPEYLTKEFPVSNSVGRYTGPALHIAAFYSQPSVIEFLVKEKGISVNQRSKGGNNWSALHVACRLSYYDTAEKLIQLGTPPDIKCRTGETPLDICRQQGNQKLFSTLLQPAHKHAAVSPDAETQTIDEWSCPTPEEVMHCYAPKGSGCLMMDIFNFEARYWKSVTRDLSGGAPTQTITFFDNMPDTQVVQKAHEKYARLGGKLSAAVIRNKPLQGK